MKHISRLLVLLTYMFIAAEGYSQATVYSRHLSPTSGVEYDTATTSGCTSCQIVDPKNAADTSTTNYTTINVQGGSSDKATLRLLLTDTAVGGGTAGILFERTGSANPAVLNSMTLRTYLGGVLKDSAVGSSALNTRTVGGSSSNMRVVEFTTTKDYDAIEIEVRKLGSGVNSMDVYHAFGDNAVALPVELFKFHAHQEKRHIRIRWSTATEFNNNGFYLEKSNNGKEFKRIDNIKTHGNSNHIKHYSAVDFEPKPGFNFYRLVQVDKDGSKSYSKIIKVDFKECEKAELEKVEVYPNPAVNSITINFNQVVSGAIVRVSDMMGNILVEQNLAPDTEEINLDLSSLLTGTYVVYVFNTDGELLYKQLITKI